MTPSRLLILTTLLALALPTAAPAHRGHRDATGPAVISLPDGWQPEGIAAKGRTLFVGSIPTGAVRKIDATTGNQETLVPAQTGRNAIGLKVKHDTLFVAGGPTGKAFLYNARTGADIAQFQLAPAGQPTFVNDVTLAKGNAYFTDSRRAALYVVAKDGSASTELPLTGITMEAGNNLNGIVHAGKGRLLAVQGNVGKLWNIDKNTGAATQVDLGTFSAVNGDGLLLAGRRVLLIVQNRLNRIAVVKLSKDLSSGRLVKTITNENFDVPTTIAWAKSGLYADNARFGTTDPQPAKYTVVRVLATRSRGHHHRHGKRGHDGRRHRR